MSLITKEKVPLELVDNVMQEVEDRVKRDKNKFSNLDFIVIMQAAFNMGAQIGKGEMIFKIINERRG